MIRITNLSKSYGTQELFKEVDFTIHAKEKVGILGRNGYGKSTLFRIFLDEEQADTGEIVFPNGYRMGSLKQHIELTEETALAEACTGLPIDQKEETWKAKKMLHGLGFSEEDFEKNPHDFSGGYQLRIHLVKTLLSEPQMLLLDEPTNYLDILSIRWLERFLQRWPGELLVISHDEAFVDAVTSQKLVIHRKRIRKMKGTVREVWGQIQQEEEVHEKSRVAQEKEKSRQDEFIRTFRSGARSAGLVQSRIKMLEKLEPKNKLDKVPPISFSFRYQHFHKNILFSAEDISYRYPDQSADLFRNLSFHIYTKDRIGIVGKNGRGKSTLLKLISEELNPTTGTISLGLNVEVGYFGQMNKEHLNPDKTILAEMRTANPGLTEQEVRSVAASLLFTGDDVFKPVKVLSGGEKNRVCLGKILLRPVNLLLLDEPTNHLDMESCDALLEALRDFPGGIAMVSHNEKILQEVTDRVVVFEHGGARLYEKNYTDFLEEIGWADEEKEPKEERVQKGKESYLNRKQQQKELRMIQKEMGELEKELEKLENDQQQNATELQEVCELGDAERIQECGMRAKEIEVDIERKFERLEELMEREGELEGE